MKAINKAIENQIADVLVEAMKHLSKATYWENKWEMSDDLHRYYEMMMQHDRHAAGLIEAVNIIINPHAPCFSCTRTWEIREFIASTSKYSDIEKNVREIEDMHQEISDLGDERVEEFWPMVYPDGADYEELLDMARDPKSMKYLRECHKRIMDYVETIK